MDPVWDQGQYNMALKCIGISEKHVIAANCSGDFSRHIWCPFLWTCVRVCVCAYICMWQMIMACIPLEEGTSYKMSCLTLRDASVLEMPHVHRKMDLRSKVKMSWEASFLLHDTELLTLCRRQTLPSPVFPGSDYDKRAHLDLVGPGALLYLTAVATETGSKQDSWEKTSLYYFL